jgi:hypothetical protein
MQDAWSSDYADDVLVLNMGRTFRTGPEPEYVAVWYTVTAGLERIGEWEQIFKAHEADQLEETFKLGARIDKAGCYDPLLPPVKGRGALYYAEYFDFADGASRDDVQAFYEARRDRHGELELNLLVDRIGYLGPDPRGLAVWSMTSWESLDAIARELDAGGGPVLLQTGGLYRDLGEETL